MAEWLPDWVNEGKETKDLLAWLKYRKKATGVFSGHILIKAAVGSCVLIYMEHHGKGEEGRIHFMKLCGILRTTDDTLYEVAPELYQAAGIPEDFSFPDKKAIQKELEEKVSIKGREMIKERWDELIIHSGLTRDQIIPAIDREQIRMTARRYFQMGKRAADIDYRPQFSFESLGFGFSDEDFLRYLDNEKPMVRSMAETWLNKALAGISKKRIYYGCVREEMAEMEKAGYIREKTGRNVFVAQDADRKTA